MTNKLFKDHSQSLNQIIRALLDIRIVLKPRIEMRKAEYQDAEHLMEVGKFLTVSYIKIYYLLFTFIFKLEEVQQLYEKTMSLLYGFIIHDVYDAESAFQFMSALITLCCFVIGAQRRQVINSFTIDVS